MLLPQTGILPCRIWSLFVELYEHTYIHKYIVHTYIQGRSQDFFISRRRKHRPEGPKSARMAESGNGVLGEDAASPSPPAMESGGALYKLPQRGPGRNPGRQTVFKHFKCSEWLLQAVLLLFIVLCFTQVTSTKARAMKNNRDGCKVWLF